VTTNVVIDQHLLAEARKIGGHRTNKAVVAAALREYIQRRKQTKIVELFRTIPFDANYDYKKQRSRK
jgi:Arc/MetJ family transcription regulator